MLISVDIPKEINDRKKQISATWGFVILRGLQSLEGKDAQVTEELFKDNEKIQMKLRETITKLRILEDKFDDWRTQK